MNKPHNTEYNGQFRSGSAPKAKSNLPTTERISNSAQLSTGKKPKHLT